MDDIDSIREKYFHSGSEEKINEGIKLLAEKYPLTEKLNLSFLDLKGTLDISPLTNLTSVDLSCNLDLSKVIGLESPKKLENLNLIHTPNLTGLDVESLKEISHVVGLRDDFGVFLVFKKTTSDTTSLLVKGRAGHNGANYKRYHIAITSSNELSTEIDHDPDYKLLNSAKLGIITSGTATLEASIFKVPHVLCYHGPALIVALARKFVKVKFLGLANLISLTFADMISFK